MEKAGWEGYEIVRTLTGDQVAQLNTHIRSASALAKLYAGDHFVDNTTGTGFVHIAPGHGMEDYLLGRAVGLPIYSPCERRRRACLHE